MGDYLSAKKKDTIKHYWNEKIMLALDLECLGQNIYSRLVI